MPGFTRWPGGSRRFPLQRTLIRAKERSMNSTVSKDPGAAFAPEFARRFALTLGTLLVLVAARFRVLGPHTVPLWTHLNRAARRITRLMDRLAAGRLTLRAPRPTGPHPIAPRPIGPHPIAPRPIGPPTLPGQPDRPHTPGFPRISAWLVRMLGYEAAGLGSQLETLLNAPETTALLAAAPSAGRTLRPLCRLLGVTLPAILQLPPRPPRAPRAPRSPRAPQPSNAARPARTPTRPNRASIVLSPFGIPRTFPPSFFVRRKKPA